MSAFVVGSVVQNVQVGNVLPNAAVQSSFDVQTTLFPPLPVLAAHSPLCELQHSPSPWPTNPPPVMRQTSVVMQPVIWQVALAVLVKGLPQLPTGVQTAVTVSLLGPHSVDAV